MKKTTKLITSITVAGKLATSPHIASAEGLGKIESSGSTLSLDQIGYPLTILTPPINADEALSNGDQGGKFQSKPSGTIFTADTGKSADSSEQPRIDFVINNIPKSIHPVVVYLAYSTTKGSPSQWEDLQLNNFFLDRNTFKIISAVQVQSFDSAFGEFNITPTPLGTKTNKDSNSVIVSLNLSDLNHPDFTENNIYFQVVAIPLVNGEFDFSAVSISELDHYEISRKNTDQSGSGSKVGEQGSKLSTESNDSGSKGDGDTGGK